MKWFRRKQHQENQASKKIVEVALAAAVPLDPTKKYLIVVDTAAVDKAQVASVLDGLRAMGIEAQMGIAADGDPWTSVQVIEVGH